MVQSIGPRYDLEFTEIEVYWLAHLVVTMMINLGHSHTHYIVNILAPSVVSRPIGRVLLLAC